MAFGINYGRDTFNSLLIAGLTTIFGVVISCTAAYALSRFQLRQTSAIILFLLATMAFPAAVTMIPGYLLMRDLHLLNTYAALILPGILYLWAQAGGVTFDLFELQRIGFSPFAQKLAFIFFYSSSSSSGAVSGCQSSPSSS